MESVKCICIEQRIVNVPVIKKGVSHGTKDIIDFTKGTFYKVTRSERDGNYYGVIGNSGRTHLFDDRILDKHFKAV